jgi:transcriptional regulator with XRE-family HTH domain
MSQPQLAKLLLTTYQQVHKYENGVNRIGASRLFDLSRALDVPISFFLTVCRTASRQTLAVRQAIRIGGNHSMTMCSACSAGEKRRH